MASTLRGKPILTQAIFGIDVTTVLNAGDKMMLDAQTLQDQCRCVVVVVVCCPAPWWDVVGVVAVAEVVVMVMCLLLLVTLIWLVDVLGCGSYSEYCRWPLAAKLLSQS